jgi:hypothetical protein
MPEEDSGDDLFRMFLKGVFTLMLLYGGGMIAVIIWGDNILATKMLNLYAGMFGGVLGLGSGYLIGRRQGK